MIRGYLNAGRPFVACGVYIPRLSLAGEVRFLVDTGADTTTVQFADAVRLGIRHEEAFAGQPQATAVGIGGTAREYIDAAHVLLRHDDGRVDNILVRMSFAALTPDNAVFPSVLGRDLISYYRLVFEQRAGLVTLENPARQV